MCTGKLGPLPKTLSEKMVARRFQTTDIDDFETIDRIVVFGGDEAITSSSILSHCALRWDFAYLQKGVNCSNDILPAQFDWSTVGGRL